MDNNIVYINQLANPDNRYAMHAHTTWEVICFTHGTGFVEDEAGERYPFSPGTVICIPPEVRHGDTADGAYRNIHMNLASPLLEQNAIRSFRDNATHDLEHLLETVYHVFMQKDVDSQILLENLYVCVRRYIRMALAHSSGTEITHARKMAQMMIDNLSDPQFQVGTVFAAFPLSPDYQRRLFKRQYGCSPQTFLTQQRIEQAKQLLLADGHIANAALSVGFYDVFYFSRVFKLCTGVAPSRWLRENRGT